MEKIYISDGYDHDSEKRLKRQNCCFSPLDSDSGRGGGGSSVLLDKESEEIIKAGCEYVRFWLYNERKKRRSLFELIGLIFSTT